MEKRRIRLEINGVLCGLITQESDEYMSALAEEVGSLMKEILAASPFITREAAALTAALGYCDDSKKNDRKAKDLQERVDELEVEAELWQEEKAEMEKNPQEPSGKTAERIAQLEAENTALAERAQNAQALADMAASLEDENAALRKAAQDEREKGDGVPQLREKMERLEEENRSAREELEKALKELALWRQRAERAELKTAEKTETAEEAEKPEETVVQTAPRKDPPKASGRKTRKNPLRYEEEYEQEGFVSFFEKKS